ncbi:MAG: hypothetical protein PF904_13930 [Kiritimatiellae bacterium]|jgi:hypothetical protein|nr:hypothetical protein [Kiritimatiellia bacterium]
MSEEEKNDARLQRGLLVEFDFAVMPGHQIMLDVCKEQLAKEGLKIDDVLMARYMFGRSFVAGLSALCRAQEISSFEVSDMVATCNEIVAEKIKNSLSSVPAAFKELIKAVADKGIKVVLFSVAESEAVLAAFPDMPEDMLAVSEDLTSSFGFTSWEGWRRFARKNGLHERLCVSICGSGLSVKGALTSGVSAIVKDNELVSYQDISGYDMQVTDFDTGIVDEIVRLLHLG